VDALDPYGNVATGYRGTVHLTSSDGQASLPADYTFLPADNSSHAFSLTLRTAGPQTVTVRDTQTGTLLGSGSLTVTLAASFRVSLPANPVTAGIPFTVTVTVVDLSGNVVTGYLGTVHFTSSDTRATLPADYTFTPADPGTHAFMVTLLTPGRQTVTATDT
jgi:hypothetical protein